MFPQLLDVFDALADQSSLVVLVMAAAALAESALGLGAVLPGEALVAVGASMLREQPVLWLAWMAVAAAAFLGDHVGYLIGRLTGPALATSVVVRKAGPDRWRRATGLVERYGTLTLILGRLLPGVRTLLAVAAGALGMSYGRYAVASGLAALLWSALWVGGGATVGTLVLTMAPAHLLMVGGALAILVTAIWTSRRLLSPRPAESAGWSR